MLAVIPSQTDPTLPLLPQALTNAWTLLRRARLSDLADAFVGPAQALTLLERRAARAAAALDAEIEAVAETLAARDPRLGAQLHIGGAALVVLAGVAALFGPIMAALVSVVLGAAAYTLGRRVEEVEAAHARRRAVIARAAAEAEADASNDAAEAPARLPLAA